MHTSLVETLRGEGIFADAWNKEFRILRGAVDPAGHLSSAVIEQKLDASLLRWPYFSVLRQGAVPPESAYTRTRDVIGHQRPGFPDAAAIHRLMAVSGTLKLNQLADWHRPTRTVVEQLQAAAPVAVASYVFWTPPESRGMLPHRDAAHVLALQLEGRKEWQLYASSGQVRAGAGLDVDTARPTHTFALEPGDVLYLPHGWPHDAVARDGDSLHLTFTLTEPTPTTSSRRSAATSSTRTPTSPTASTPPPSNSAPRTSAPRCWSTRPTSTTPPGRIPPSPPCGR
ncbi:cupin domain-containing protein [Streptomyces sp. S1D4-11]